MAVKSVVAGVFILLVLLPGIVTKYLRGHLTTQSNLDWQFLTRFCFISEAGKFEYYFEYEEEYANQDVLLYYDDVWLPVYTDDHMNCSRKKAALSYKDGQILTLAPSFTEKCHSFIKKDGSKWINCSDHRTFQTSRERWWFVVVAKCGTTKGMNLYYKLHMTNGDGYLYKEFSADEIYIFPMQISTFLLMCLQLALSIHVAVKLISKQLFHTTYKLYMASLTLYICHLFLQTVAYGKYANDGMSDSFYRTKLTGRLSEAVSRLIFLLLLILMAKGFTITRGRLSSKGSIRLAIFMTIYTILYSIVFIWEAKFFDEGKVLYFYESVPGYAIIGLRVLGWVWFLYAVFFTIKHYPKKAKFYVPFTIFYSIWFWASPVVVITAVTVMSKWTREKSVVGVECVIAILGYLFFLIFTWPSVANKHFPFHVRTSQVDVMDSTVGFPDEDDSQCSGTVFKLSSYSDSFRTENTSGPNFTDLFVVSQTRSKPDPALQGKSRHGELPPLDHRPRIPTAPYFHTTKPAPN